jgi:predicted transcriptional regulator
MKDYLLSLAEDGLIEYEQGMMRTTPKGMHVLQLYNSVNEMVQSPVLKIENKKNDLFF